MKPYSIWTVYLHGIEHTITLLEPVLPQLGKIAQNNHDMKKLHDLLLQLQLLGEEGDLVFIIKHVVKTRNTGGHMFQDGSLFGINVSIDIFITYFQVYLDALRLSPDLNEKRFLDRSIRVKASQFAEGVWDQTGLDEVSKNC